MKRPAWLRFAARPAATTVPAPPVDEVETIPVGHPIESYYPFFLNAEQGLAAVDDLVREKGLQVYRDMQDRDDQVASCVGVLKSARLSSGYTLTAASDDPKDQEIRDFIDYDLGHMTRYSTSRLLRDSMDAVPMGVAVMERLRAAVYPEGPWKGKQGLARFIPLPVETVTFQRDDTGDIAEDGIWQAKNRAPVWGSTDPAYFDKMPAHRFEVWSWRSKWNSPFGQSALRPAYRWYFQKARYVEWLARFLEYHGQPWVIGESANEQAAMLDKLRRFQSHQRMVVKPGSKIDIHDPSTAPVANFITSIDLANRSIARCLMTPALLFDHDGAGSLALGQAQKGVYEWTQEDLGQDLESGVMQPVIRAEVDHNFGPQYEVPVWKFKPYREPEREVAGRLIDLMVKWGVPVSASMVYKALSFEPPKEGEELLKQPAAPDPNGASGLPPEVLDMPEVKQWMVEYHKAATQGGTEDDLAGAVNLGAGNGDRPGRKDTNQRLAGVGE